MSNETDDRMSCAWHADCSWCGARPTNNETTTKESN